MAKHFEFETKIGDGEKAIEVRYSAKRRGKQLAVVFVGPDGKRVEKMTGVKPTGKHPDANFHNEAARVLVRSFPAVFAHLNASKVTWADALDKVEKTAADLRPDTIVAYRKAVRVLLATLADENVKPATPSDVTPVTATLFARTWLAGTFRRGKATDAKQYKRKPTTLAFYLRQLSALWQQFADLGFAPVNPWKSVRKPQTDKVRKHVPTEDEITAFFDWVTTRYPNWERLHALLELKALSGCRSLDLCQLRSDQLRNGRVTWSASQTKQRDARSVLLPDDLFKTLKRLAGPSYLWEGFVADMAAYRPSKNRSSETFDPKTVYWAMNNIFREYVEAHPDRPNLTPHALRRRAITLVVGQTGSVDATAQAIGLNPATARTYYLDSQRAFNTDEVFRQASGSLRPKRKSMVGQ